MPLFSLSSFTISSRAAIAILSVLLIVALVTMPISIRPAAYNQHEAQSPATARRPGSADDQGLLGTADDDDDRSSASDAVGSNNGGKFKLNTFVLSLYVVFHKSLDDSLFEDLKIPNALPEAPRVNMHNSGEAKDAGSILDVVLTGNGDVTFFETNKAQERKDYNDSNPLFHNRLVKEWETHGWRKTEEYGNVLNEYGAMASIYYSHYTYSSWKNPTDTKSINVRDSLGNPKLFRLQRGLDDCFIGILHADMRLTTRVIQMLRRRIERTRDWSDYVAGARLQEQQQQREREQLGGSIRIAAQERAVRLSRLHQTKKRRGANEPKCCVFYAIQYPMQYLLKRDAPSTQKLMRLYNAHFQTKYTYDDLARFAILDAFIIPFTEYNKLVPFLENLMRNYVSTGVLKQSKESRKEALHELEQAQALFLGLMGRDGGYQYVMVPLRHEPKS